MGDAELQMSTIIRKLIAGVDITEIYSPRRVIEIACQLGLKEGLSMDLISGWDFNKAEDRNHDWAHILRDKPLFIIGSPPCTSLSVLQALNWGRDQRPLDSLLTISRRSSALFPQHSAMTLPDDS